MLIREWLACFCCWSFLFGLSVHGQDTAEPESDFCGVSVSGVRCGAVLPNDPNPTCGTTGTCTLTLNSETNEYYYKCGPKAPYAAPWAEYYASNYTTAQDVADYSPGSPGVGMWRKYRRICQSTRLCKNICFTSGLLEGESPFCETGAVTASSAIYFHVRIEGPLPEECSEVHSY